MQKNNGYSKKLHPLYNLSQPPFVVILGVVKVIHFAVPIALLTEVYAVCILFATAREG